MQRTADQVGGDGDVRWTEGYRHWTSGDSVSWVLENAQNFKYPGTYYESLGTSPVQSMYEDWIDY